MNEKSERFIEACGNMDYNELLELVENKELRNKAATVGDLFSSAGEEFLEPIMEDIIHQFEREGYEYWSEVLKQIIELDFLDEFVRNTASTDFKSKALNDASLDLRPFDKKIIKRNIGDVSLAREYLKDKNLDIISFDKTTMIISTQNADFIKECIANEELGISPYDKIRLICETKDVDFIKEQYKKSQAKWTRDKRLTLLFAIAKEGDIDFIKESFLDRTLGLDKSEKIQAITLAGNNVFIKECIFEEELGFDQNEKVELIAATKDIGFIKACMMDERLSLSNELINELLSKTGYNIELVKAYIEGDFFGLDKNQKLRVVLETGNYNFAREYVLKEDFEYDSLSEEEKRQVSLVRMDQKEIENFFSLSIDRSLNLPSQMTIGMEIECEGASSNFLRKMFKYKNWKSKDELTVPNGVEIVSPILHSTIEDSSEIYSVTNLLTYLRQKNTEICGGHVHIGADYLTTKESYANLMELWCSNERALYIVSNEIGQAPRSAVSSFALSISGKLFDAIENGTISLTNEGNLNDFIKKIKFVQEGRYTGLNFMNVNNFKNTIEFRMANGTLNPEMWVENANLFGGIVAASEELARIQRKEKRTGEEERKLKLFDELKSDRTEKEKLEILLDLVGVEPKTYIERYESNVEMVESDIDMDFMFENNKIVDFRRGGSVIHRRELNAFEVSTYLQLEAEESIIESQIRTKIEKGRRGR